MAEITTPTPTRTTEPTIEPERRMDPDRLCPAQKEKIVREIERVI